MLEIFERRQLWINTQFLALRLHFAIKLLQGQQVNYWY